MISTLHGILFEKTPGSVVIECGGVGYEATIPLGAYNELPAAGSECRLFVRHVVREDDEQLYGFALCWEDCFFPYRTDKFDNLKYYPAIGVVNVETFYSITPKA